MKAVRVVLGAVPQLVEAILRDVLMDAPDIEIVTPADGAVRADYDVLLLNALEGEADPSGYTSPRPAAGIVMVGAAGRSACVFRRTGDDLCLEEAAQLTLRKAIMLAAGRG